MKKNNLFLLTLFAFLLSSCTGNIQYRQNYEPCVSVNPIQECQQNSIQELSDPQKPDENYLLGFVEFDEQGILFDRQQYDKLDTKLYEEAYKNNLLMIVFVHGWKHNADVNDTNIASFRETLKEISRLENQVAQVKGIPPRKVAGIYLGWRGQSLDAGFLSNITFWDRKEVAHHVGNQGVQEILSRLEMIRNVELRREQETLSGKTRLIIIGHSFGGAVAYSSTKEILTERFITTDSSTKGPMSVSNVRSFGDLILLINPAFEALEFSTLWNMAQDRKTYFPAQSPVLAVLTSEADIATKVAFPIGRFFSTVFEKHRSDEVLKLNRTAIGHYEKYRTHTLVSSPSNVTPNVSQIDAEKATYQHVLEGWCNDGPGKEISFPGTTLKHLNKTTARNPFLLVNVENTIIPNHNDIYRKKLRDFLRFFIILADNHECKNPAVQKQE